MPRPCWSRLPTAACVHCEPSAHLAIARAAQREGRPDLALVHAREALDRAGLVDPWVELPAALRREAQALLDTAGRLATTRASRQLDAGPGKASATG